MTDLPDCLTKLDQSMLAAQAPKRFVDCIVSRPNSGMRLTNGSIMMWSHIPAHRRILTREGMEALVQEKVLVCIIREFDQIPQK